MTRRSTRFDDRLKRFRALFPAFSIILIVFAARAQQSAPPNKPQADKTGADHLHGNSFCHSRWNYRTRIAGDAFLNFRGCGFHCAVWSSSPERSRNSQLHQSPARGRSLHTRCSQRRCANSPPTRLDDRAGCQPGFHSYGYRYVRPRGSTASARHRRNRRVDYFDTPDVADSADALRLVRT